MRFPHRPIHDSTGNCSRRAAPLALGAALIALRGQVLPGRLPAEGLSILRDGEPGEPAVTLSPLASLYQHRAEIEAVEQGPERDGAFDVLILARAAEEGAKRARAIVGLEGGEAMLDIRDLRLMPDLQRLVRSTAVQSVVRVVTTAVLLALLVGVALKLKIFGCGP